jgi:hypothetical protein
MVCGVDPVLNSIPFNFFPFYIRTVRNYQFCSGRLSSSSGISNFVSKLCSRGHWQNVARAYLRLVVSNRTLTLSCTVRYGYKNC